MVPAPDTTGPVKPAGHWKDGRMELWNNGRMEEWTDGWMEEWKNGRME
jgi:hypothetical protein